MSELRLIFANWLLDLVLFHVLPKSHRPLLGKLLLIYWKITL